MRLFFVVGPEREDWFGTYWDPPEPPEYGRDVIEIEAANKRDAVILGVAEIMRAQRRCTARDNRSDGLPPWAGYRAFSDDELK